MFSERDIRRLALPIAIDQFFLSAAGIAVTMIASSLGKVSVSAVSLVDNINIIITGFFSAVAVGITVAVSNCIGSSDFASANSTVFQSSAATLLFSSFLSALLVSPAGSALIHVLFGAAEQPVLDQAESYLRISALSYPFFAQYSAAAGAFRANQDSRTPMYISLLMNAASVAIGALLVYAFGLGVAGLAAAVLFSRFMGCALATLLLSTKASPARLEFRSPFRLDWGRLGSVLAVGVPAGMESVIFQLGKIVTAAFIVSYGTVAVAANAIASSVFSLASLPGVALSVAIIPMAAQCMGAGRPDEASRYIKSITIRGMLYLLVFNLPLFAFAGRIAGLFSPPPGADGMISGLLRITALSLPLLWPHSFILPAGLRGVGDAKFTMGVSMASMWLCRISAAYILGSLIGLGVYGVWIAMVMDWAVRGAVFLHRLLRGKWAGAPASFA